MRIVVQDPVVLRRDALVSALALEEYVDVVAQVAEPHEVVSACRSERIDAALIAAPREALDAVPRIKAASPATRLIFLVGPDDGEDLVPAARASGVDHIVNVRFGLEVLVDVVWNRRSNAFRPARSRDEPASNLTAREREVLERIAAGASRTMIADALCISPKTVDNHKRNVMVKLGAANQAHAVSLALERGLLRRESRDSALG